MAKLEQGILKTDKSSNSSTTTTTSTIHVEFEKKPPKPVVVAAAVVADYEEETPDSVRKKHKHCRKHKHHKSKSRSSTCHHHHHHHCHHNHNHKTKARRRSELLKEIKEGKLELPKKKPLIRTFSLWYLMWKVWMLMTEVLFIRIKSWTCLGNFVAYCKYFRELDSSRNLKYTSRLPEEFDEIFSL